MYDLATINAMNDKAIKERIADARLKQANKLRAARKLAQKILSRRPTAPRLAS